MKENLPKFLKIRLLQINDYYKGFFELLAELTHCEKLSFKEFKEIYKENLTNSKIYVWEDTKTKKLIGSIKIIFERKFFRKGKYVAYLEDIIVKSEYRNKKLGKFLINFAINLIKKKNNCYKIIGDCKDDLINYYKKFSFEFKNLQFSLYLNLD